MARFMFTNADVAAAKEKAAQMLETWGEFVHEKKSVLDLCALEDLNDMQVIDLQKLILGTASKVREKSAEISLAHDPICELTDDEVETGLRHLTDLDGDKAAIANKRGWGKSTTSPGHFATAMLAIDRELALKAGRMILPVHRKQLSKILPSWGGGRALI